MQTVALVGFPNSGKSTIYNLLSGGRRKVSNYSGITVDAAIGEFKTNAKNDQKLSIVDLPGTYNLTPGSIDEAVTTSFLLGFDKSKKYHLVALVLDLERIESSLSLCLALKELIGERLVIVVNKNDKEDFSLENGAELAKLTGLKVMAMAARSADGIKLDAFLRDNVDETAIAPISTLELSADSTKYLKIENGSVSVNLENSQEDILASIGGYHKEAREIINKVFVPSKTKAEFTKKIDKVLVHPFFGSLIFISIFYFIFNSIYTWAGPVMDFIDGGIGNLGGYLAGVIPAGLFNSLITDGIIAGVGGVLVFLPQIMILFFLLSVLEQSGYISRAAVLTDKVMGYFGLNGKAFLPYLSGFACSIPGIMAARTIPSKKERLATILTLPLITCSARLPVYVLLIGTFVPSETVLGIFNTQALSFFFLYFLGSFFALTIALVFRLTYFKGETSSFFMDLPLYQLPSLKTAIKESYSKGKLFLKKAGTIILGLSIIIWFASTFPKVDPQDLVGKTEAQVASLSLENSALGILGRAIEPIIKPIGMDWKMGVGILVAFGARELFVSTMGTIYALGDVDEENQGLRDRLMNEKNPITGEPVFNLAVAWSILIFFVFSLQCTATLAVIKKETDGWKAPLFTFVYMGVFAYLGSFIAYRLLV